MIGTRPSALHGRKNVVTRLEKVTLTGAQETMLATLYARARASRADNPILVDRAAERAVTRLDYDVSKLKLSTRDANSVAIRAKAIDRWTAQHLAAHPDITVLHLGCGLDSRGDRLDVAETTQWYDIDFPDVIELRRKIYPPRPGQHTIGSSVTDPNVFDDIPSDRPVLVVAEGLTMYLSTVDGQAMLRRIVDHFPGGTVICDVFSSLGIWFSNRFNRVVLAAGAHLEWGVDDVHELERAVPGLTFDVQLNYADLPEMARYPWIQRTLLTLLFRIPAIRKMGRIVRYHF